MMKNSDISNFNKNPFLNTIVRYYIEEEKTSENMVIFGGFINEKLSTIDFSKGEMDKNEANLILYRYSNKEVFHE